MGTDPLGNAIVYLHIAKIWAYRGYPDRVMPHITKPTVAVNIHKHTPEGMTVVATVCVPMSLGVYACEDMADQIEKVWTAKGGVVTYGEHSFDGKSGMYLMPVYGYWAYQTEETEEA